jgi:choline kinase
MFTKTKYPHLSAIIIATEMSDHNSEFNLSPRCLLKFHDQTLLERQINSLKRSGLENVLVISGYMQEEIKAEKIRANLNFDLIFDDLFAVNGNAYSLYLGLKNIDQSVIILYSDILIDPQVIDSFIENAPENSILCGNANIDDIKCIKIFSDKKNKIRSIADKRHPNITETTRHIFQGKLIGMIKLSNEYRLNLVTYMEQLFCEDYNKSIKLEDVFTQFIKKNELMAFKTKSQNWIEIETKEDLRKANIIAERLLPVV